MGHLIGAFARRQPLQSLGFHTPDRIGNFNVNYDNENSVRPGSFRVPGAKGKVDVVAFPPSLTVMGVVVA